MSNASIACRPAGNSSCSLRAVFIPQVPSCDTSPCILALAPNSSFGEISSIRHKSEIRVETTAFVPVSYLCTCWCVTPRALPSAPWLSPNFARRIRITEPIFLSTTRSRLRFIAMSLPYPSQNRRCSAVLFHSTKEKAPAWLPGQGLYTWQYRGRTRRKSLIHIQRECSARVKQATYPATPRPCQISGDSSSGS